MSNKKKGFKEPYEPMGYPNDDMPLNISTYKIIKIIGKIIEIYEKNKDGKKSK